MPKALITAGFAALFALSAIAAELSAPAGADQPPANQGGAPLINPRKQMREHWERMSPEEREQVRKKMKDHWDSMTPEQREASRKQMREHFKNMSPEERRQFKRDMGAQEGMPDDNTGTSGRK